MVQVCKHVELIPEFSPLIDWVRWLIRKEFGLRSDRDAWSNAKDFKAKDHLPGEAKAHKLPQLERYDDKRVADAGEASADLESLKGESRRNKLPRHFHAC